MPTLQSSFQWREVTCPECRLIKDRDEYERKFKTGKNKSQRKKNE
ncbi:MAG: hypothetical protein PHS34_08850 [Candidatus Omnitrophica bacterium]|nr:hypothetical protein [Candidatus Omnitrophota bacterium]